MKGLERRLDALEAKAGPEIYALSDEQLQARIDELIAELATAGIVIDPNADLSEGLAQIRAALDAADAEWRTQGGGR